MLSMMLISTYVYEPIIAYTSCIFMRYICFHTTLHLIRLIDARTHTHRQRHIGKRQKPSTSLWGYLRLDRLACVMKPDVSTCLIGNDRHLPMHAHPNFEPIFCIPSLLYDKDIIICICIYIYIHKFVEHHNVPLHIVSSYFTLYLLLVIKLVYTIVCYSIL